MKDEEKTKEKLMDELQQLRQRITGLEAAEAESKKTAEVLRESQVRYKELAESITDVFFAMDEKLKYTYWNKASEELLGISAKDALGKTIYDLFPDDEATRRAEETYRRTLTTKKPHHLINNFPIGGRDFVFEISTYPTTGGLCVYVKDVTDRKKLEEALKESEQWYRHVFHNAPFGIGLSSIDGKVINFNKAMETMTGYSAEDFSKINLADTYENKADREVLLNEIRQHGGVVDYPVKLKRKDGTPYDVLLSIRLTTIGDKEFVQTIQHDVTERKRVEEALRESERRYRQLFENAALAIFQSTPGGKLIAVNPEFARMFGYESPEDVLSNVKNIATDLFVDPQRRSEILRLMAEDQNLRMFENLYRRKDGRTFLGKLNMRPITDSDGRVLCMEGFIEDISERKRAEEALKESEERYRALVELSPEAIFVASEGKHVFVNSAGLELFGASSPDQIIGKPVTDVIHPDYRAAVTERIGEAIRTGKASPTAEEKFLRLDGTEIDVEVRAAPLIYQGRPAMQAVVRNISERKQADEALRLSEQNFRDSIESSPLGIRIVDESGKSLYANRALLDMYGYSSLKELEAVPRKRRYTPQSYAEHLERVEKRKRGEYVPDHYEVSIVRSDGQVRYLSVSRGEVLWNGEKQFQMVYQDLTERKLAEEQYQTIVRTTMDGFWITDMQGRFLDVNEAYCQLIGYSRDELLTMSIPDIEVLEKTGNVAQRIHKIKESGQDRFETCHRRKDGGIVDVEVSINYLPTASGRFFVFLRDITERKQAEARMRMKDYAMASSISGILVLDMDGVIIYANQAYLDMWAYRNIEEAIGSNITEAAADKELANRLLTIVRTKGEWNGELRATLKDGSIIDVLLSVSFVRDEKNVPIAIMASVSDITERKKAEEALRASEARYRLLAENVRDVIWSTDMDLRFTYVSPSVKYIGDRTAEEVMSMSLGQLLTPSSQELIMKTFAEELVRANTMPPDPTRSRTIEVEFMRRDGSILWAELKTNFIRGVDNQPVGILGVMRDISERKQNEGERREFEQKAQLASRLASVGELASGIAHEINNPLTGVIGYSELLMQEDVPEHIKDDLEIVHDGAKRIADIVKGLLKFARQTKPERELIYINEIIEVTLRLRAYELKTSNIKVTTKLAPGLPLTFADAGQLQQVFLNLLINAEMEMRLAHGRGKLTVKTEHADKTIRITFKDDGPGIAKENLEKIFDPFFTTRELGEGTGLGLSICHGIVAEHDGKIWAESRLGKGATFIVELPLITREKRPRHLKTAVKPQKVIKGKILVVDDEPAVRQLIAEVLTAEGHEVETTADGKDALNRIKDNEYSLILVDMKLPGMSGGELYERIQVIAESLAQRVVFITGDVMAVDTEAFLTRTGVPFIAKPFNVEQLKAEINRLLTTSHLKPNHKSKVKSKKSKAKT